MFYIHNFITSSQQPSEVHTIINSIFQIGKLRNSEFVNLAQDNTTDKEFTTDLNSNSLAVESPVLNHCSAMSLAEAQARDLMAHFRN